MEFSSKLIENAVNEISKLPGIGKRTALRLVLFLLRQPSDQSSNLAKAISEMRVNVNFCNNCHNIRMQIQMTTAPLTTQVPSSAAPTCHLRW